MTVSAAASTPVPPVTTLTPIPAIQGSGVRSPLTGEKVTTEGTVTGMKLSAPNSKGVITQTIFIQDAKGDGDARTSDGMAIRPLKPLTDVKIGQHLTATGTVDEKYHMTALSGAAVELGGQDAPIKPQQITLPNDAVLSQAQLESLEGMVVAYPTAKVMGGIDDTGAFTVYDPATHGPHKDFDKSIAGSHLVVATDMGFKPMVGTDDTVDGIAGPVEQTSDGYDVQLANDVKRTAGAPAPKLWGDLDGNGVVDAADVAAIGKRAGGPATGQLDAADMDGDGAITKADAKLAQSRATHMASTAPSFRVANLNAENFFDTVDDPSKRDEVPTQAQFDAKVQHLSSTVADTLGAPSLVAMEEVENTNVLDALVKSPALAKFGYKYELLPGIDNRGINTALLYRADQGVTVSNAHQMNERARQDKWGDFDPKGTKEVDLFKRPPMFVDVKVPGVNGSGDENMTMVLNHFTSAYAPNGFSTEPWRTEQAKFIRAQVSALQKQDPSHDVFVVGDLNADESSDPMHILGSGASPLRSVAEAAVPKGERYSYVYRGSSEELDHMFATKGVLDRVNFAQVHHIDADVPATDQRPTDHDLLEAQINFPAAPASAPAPATK